MNVIDRKKVSAQGVTRIFLVDDHPLFREGLVHLIQREENLQICGESSTGRGALSVLPIDLPDLLILDMNLPDLNGLEVIKDLKVILPDLAILVLSMHDEALYAERSIRAGAKGYLMKDSGGEELLKAIKKITAGEMAVSEKISSRLLGSICGKSSKEDSTGKLDVGRLTDRELQVFQLVGKGVNSHEIGALLGISNRTVDAHRMNIKEKLGLADSMALARYAVWWVEMG